MAASSRGGFAAAVLAPAGIHALYGSPSAGLPVTRAEPGIAGVLALAHRAVHNSAAGAVTGASGTTIEVPGATGALPETVVVRTGDDVVQLVGSVRGALRGGGIRMQLEVDPSRPWPPASGDAVTGAFDPWSGDLADLAEQVAASDSVVVLAGPGVVWARAAGGLHALAAVLGAGVLNTWGAKGVFHWRSRHHWATVGLQAHDFELGGLAGADLVVVSGVDEREAPRECWADRPHLVVPPETLAPLAEALVPRLEWAPRRPARDMPPLRARLAAATQAGWESTTAPLAPSRATRSYGRRLTDGGLVAADAGLAGFWVARTFATTELGMVAVPPEEVPGWAAACVAVARLVSPLRPALGVLDDEVDQISASVVEFARARGRPVGLEVWSAAGERVDAEAHAGRLRSLTEPTGPGGRATLATDASQLQAFVEAAGPLRPWRRPGRAA